MRRRISSLLPFPALEALLPRQLAGGGGGGAAVRAQTKKKDKELQKEEEELKKRQQELKESLLEETPAAVAQIDPPPPPRSSDPEVIGAARGARTAQAKRKGITKTRVAGRTPTSTPLGGNPSLLG